MYSGPALIQVCENGVMVTRLSNNSVASGLSNQVTSQLSEGRASIGLAWRDIRQFSRYVVKTPQTMAAPSIIPTTSCVPSVTNQYVRSDTLLSVPTM